MIDTAHSCVDAQGRQCVHLCVTRGAHTIGKEAERLGDPDVYEYKMVDAGKSMKRSGNEAPKLTYHGTTPDAFLPILVSGGLTPGPSTPAGVYVCPDVRTADMSMYNKGLIVVCKTLGFPFNYDNYKNILPDRNSIPSGCIGYLREVIAMKQLCAHPRCLQLEGFIFELGALVKLVDAELEDLGYSHKYHEEVTKVLAKVKDRWRMIVEEERAVEEQRAAERPRPLAVGLQAGGAPLPPPAATTLEADEEHYATHASQTCDRCLDASAKLPVAAAAAKERLQDESA